MESEEDLIYFTAESKVPLREKDIMKMTDLKVVEKRPGDEVDVERVHVALKPWERQER